MKTQITYCKSWFRAKKIPMELWSESDARTAHEGKKLYGVIVGPVERPFCFLEINRNFVGVGFLDIHARETLYYAFREVRPGILFLSMATYRDYIGETDKVATGTSYMFQEDDVVMVQKQTINPPNSETFKIAADINANYSVWPEFGRYDDLIRVERS